MINLYTALTTLIAVTKDRLEHEEKGATAVEYGLMVGLIAVVIIVAVRALGVNLQVLFNDIVAALPG